MAIYATDASGKRVKVAGGGGGVTSFNGKSGAITAQEAEVVSSTDVVKIRKITKADYDALTAKDPNTLYIMGE